MHKNTIAFFSQFGVTVGILDIENTFAGTIKLSSATAESIALAINDDDDNVDPLALTDLFDELSHIVVLNPIVMARGPQGQGILQPIIPMFDIKSGQRPAVFPTANLVLISAKEVSVPYFEATSTITLAGASAFAKA